MKPASAVKLTQFPHETFKTNISWDEKRVSLADEKGDAELLSLFANLQQLEVCDGYKFAEDVFLKKDIKTLTPQWLEWFIKRLHKISTYSLCALNYRGHPAGVYNRHRVYVAKEAPSGESYDPTSDPSSLFSQNNYDILNKNYGAATADLYKSFCDFILGKWQEFQAETNAQQRKLTWEEVYHINTGFFEKLLFSDEVQRHPGFAIWWRTMAITTPAAEIPAKMQELCGKLCRLIQEDADPAKIAATSLELTYIHPFPDGNGRVGRTLMNCILMSCGYEPLLFSGEEKAAYYRAVEASQQDERAIENFLRPFIKKAEPKPNNDVARMVLIDQWSQLAFVDLGSEQVMLQQDRLVPFFTERNVFHRNGAKFLSRSYTHLDYERLGMQHAVDEPRAAIYFFLLAVKCINASKFEDSAKSQGLSVIFYKIADCCLRAQCIHYAYIYASRAWTLAASHPNGIEPLKIETLKLLELLAFFKKQPDLSTFELASALFQDQPEPVLPLALKMEADQCLEQGNPARAIVLYQRALEHLPADFSACYNKGRAHFKLKQYPEAQKSFERALQLNPKHLLSLECLARTQIALKQQEAALATLQRYVDIKPNVARINELITACDDGSKTKKTVKK